MDTTGEGTNVDDNILMLHVSVPYYYCELDSYCCERSSCKVAWLHSPPRVHRSLTFELAALTFIRSENSGEVDQCPLLTPSTLTCTFHYIHALKLPPHLMIIIIYYVNYYVRVAYLLLSISPPGYIEA